MSWHNRIVGHDEVPPDQLMAHPDNWRIHPKYQQEALRGVINDIGYIKSVTVNKTTGRVVDGHLRVTLALRDNIPLIPVEYVELTEAEEAEALLTLDPIAALAGSDKDNLELLLGQVNTDDAAVSELLDSLHKEEQETDEELLLDQAVQLEPAREYVVIMCSNAEEFYKLREVFNLQEVRRGGYKAGSAFDATGIQRVINAHKLFEVLDARSNTK
jgi:hypothetical protein